MSPETRIKAHQYLYYVLGRPIISDSEYDALCKKHGIDGSGGSDMESSYSKEEIDAALILALGR
jgi:NAD-dependent DNA ligase